jgi:hypothetical protein
MTTPTFTARPGLIGLVPVAGEVGRLIRFGQWLNGNGWGLYQHAFMALPGGLILEAEPGGARIVPLHYTDVYWCHGLYRLLPPHTTETEIAHIGESMKGIKYSFLDYLALSARRLHIEDPALRRYIANTGHEICSQLDDDFYLRLGAHIFMDGRWPGDVTPMDLYNRDQELVRAA